MVVSWGVRRKAQKGQPPITKESLKAAISDSFQPSVQLISSKQSQFPVFFSSELVIGPLF